MKKTQEPLKELPLKLKLDNILLAAGMPINLLSSAEFTIRGWKARHEKGKPFHMPRVITIYNYLQGTSMVNLLFNVLERVGIDYSHLSYHWEIEQGHIVLVGHYLIPGDQAWMAQVQLLWYQEQFSYVVEFDPVAHPVSGVSSRVYASRHAPWKIKRTTGKSRHRGFTERIGKALFGRLLTLSYPMNQKRKRK